MLPDEALRVGLSLFVESTGAAGQTLSTPMFPASGEKRRFSPERRVSLSTTSSSGGKLIEDTLTTRCTAILTARCKVPAD